MKKFITICLAICFLTGVRAQCIETLLLADGTSLEGYMSVQRVGKDITFFVSRGVINIPKSCVDRITEQAVDTSSLGDAWKKWVRTHQEAVTRDGKLVLSNIHLKDEEYLRSDTVKNELLKDDKAFSVLALLSSSPHSVRVVEKGEIIKYIDMSPTVYTLDWKDIKVLRRMPRSSLMLSGVNTIIRLQDSGRELEGEIVEQIPGKQMKIRGLDGVTEVVNITDIASVRKVKINSHQSLFEQVPLLETVRTKTGDFTGVITEQSYGEKASLTVEMHHGVSQTLNAADVLEFRRVRNNRYNPLEDVIISNGMVLLNRHETSFMDMEQESGMVYTKDFDKALVLKNALSQKELVVEMEDNPSKKELVMIRAVEQKGEKRKEKDQTVSVGFTFENLAIYSIRPTIQEVTQNGTLRMTFPVNVKGWYVLYLPKEKKGILCNVEN